MEILTNNKDGFYNFATVRISKLRSDIGSQYSDILSDWDELKQFVEEYCQYFEDDITNFLSEIDDKPPLIGALTSIITFTGMYLMRTTSKKIYGNGQATLKIELIK